VVKYRVVVAGRVFEIEVGPEGQVWVNRRRLDVDLEGIDGLPQYSLLVDHRSYETHVEGEEEGECRLVVAGRPFLAHLQGATRRLALAVRQQGASGTDPAPAPQEVTAPLPGVVVAVRVVEGQRVREGEVVAVLESMKMNLELRAPRAGVVHALHAAAGREVAQGEVLAVIDRP